MKLPDISKFQYCGKEVLLIPEEVVIGTRQYQVNVVRGAPTHIRSKLIVGIGWYAMIDATRYLGRASKREAQKWAKDKIDGKFRRTGGTMKRRIDTEINRQKFDRLHVKLDDGRWLIPCPECFRNGVRTQVQADLSVPEYIRCPACGHTVRTND